MDTGPFYCADGHEDVLRAVFDVVDDAEYRRRVLPLVCKPWAAACRGPSPMWRSITIDADAHAAANSGRRLRWAQARKWVSQRAVSVRELVLRPRHAASAGAIAPLWPRLAGSLRSLDLSLERELPDYQPQEDLVGLSHLMALKSLKLTGPAAPSCRVSAGLAAGLAPLGQLKELTLKLQACPFTMLRPDLPGVLLGALVNLRVLDLDLASFAPPAPVPTEGEDGEEVPPSPGTNVAGANMLPACVTRLTKLEELRLAGDWRRPKVVLPPGFAGLSALRRLTLATLYLGREASPPSGFSPPPQPAPQSLVTLELQDCTGDFCFGSGLDGLRTLRLEACDEMHMAASTQQAIRDAKQLDATVVISDATLERLPNFLDGLPPSVHLMTKQQLRRG